jgi:iron complex outermembrane receptor protein
MAAFKPALGPKSLAFLRTGTSVAAIMLVGHYYALAQEPTPIPPVSVYGTLPVANDGSAAAGYREETVTGGIGSFWGDLPTQDVPYSVQITPHELIDNLTQVTNLQDALKYNPDLQYGAGFGFGGGVQYLIRGIYVNPSQAVTTDNLYSPFGFYTAPEDKESISVLTGVSGFLYGVQSVSGHIDTELKRPTATPLFDIIGGTNSGHNGYVHLDMGGPIEIPGLDPGIFGYRLNLVEQGGGTYVHGEDVSRNLASRARRASAV